MNYYSVDSVIAELQANNTLVCQGIGDVGCPSPAPLSITHEGNCPGDSSVCNDCTNKICNQRITIREVRPDGKYIKLRTIFFNFLFTAPPHGGRIPIDDSLLDLLIRRKLIDKDKLVSC
jgi:hypothetical protein